MHLIETATGESLISAATARAPFGPNIPMDIAKQAAIMEIWGSSIRDDGADFCRFILKRSDGSELLRVDLGGY